MTAKAKVIDIRAEKSKRESLEESRLERLVIERWTGKSDEQERDNNTEMVKR